MDVDEDVILVSVVVEVDLGVVAVVVMHDALCLSQTQFPRPDDGQSKQFLSIAY